jgi:hemerythrin-like domain-containing protein
MSDTEALVEQNRELLDALTRIGIQLRLGSNHNGPRLHRTLTEIVQKLERHILKEEAELYPALDSSRRVSVRQISKRTHRELETADHRIARFLERWANVDAIDGAHEAFRSDAIVLVEALRRALADERRRLFPLMNQRRSA